MTLLYLVQFMRKEANVRVSQNCKNVYEGKIRDLMRYLLDREVFSDDIVPNIQVVNIDTGMEYFDPYDRYDEGEPVILITVSG